MKWLTHTNCLNNSLGANNFSRVGLEHHLQQHLKEELLLLNL